MSYFRKETEPPQIIMKDMNEIEAVFELSNVSTTFANALRRVMIAEIPTMAIESVEFWQNTSPIADEVISQRLGLVPLASTDSFHLSRFDECQCGGKRCARCSVSFICNCSTEIGETRLVTSDDLIQAPPEEYSDFSERSKGIVPAVLKIDDEHVPITIAKLGSNQRLQFRAWASRGIGRNHSKFSPVSICSYIHIPKITLAKNYLREKIGEGFAQSCPTRVFRYDSNEDVVKIEDEKLCTFCNQCIEFLEENHISQEIIDLGHQPDRFIFTIESIGMLLPRTIILTAFDILSSKLSDFLEQTKQYSNASTYGAE